MVSAYTWGTIKMICPKCKEVYEDGSVFCVSCGTRLVSEDFKVSEGDPIKRHSSRFKTSKPKNEPKDVPEMENKQEIKKEKPAKATAQKSKEAELTYKEFVLLKKLTDREILVLDSLIDSNGQSVKAQELAEKLDIPRDYIYKYIKNLRKKLQNATIGNSEEGGFVIEKP